MLNVVYGASLWMRVMAVLLVVFSVCVQDAHAVDPKKRAVIANIVFIGDDIISGEGILNPADSFMSKVKARVAKDNLLAMDVYDFTRPGETADSVVLQMKSILAVHPDMAVLAIGFNDAMQKTDLDVFYNSMDSILNELYNAGVYVMIVSIPAPKSVDDAYEAEFNRVFPKLVERYRTYFISDIMDNIYDNRHMTQVDLLHPNKEGVDAMTKKFFRVMYKMMQSYKDVTYHCRRRPDSPRCMVDDGASARPAAAAAPASLAPPVAQAPVSLPITPAPAVAPVQ